MCELNENQARVYTHIDRELSKIKSDTRKLYRKEPVKQVKHTTEKIRQVYYSAKTKIICLGDMQS